MVQVEHGLRVSEACLALHVPRSSHRHDQTLACMGSRLGCTGRKVLSSDACSNFCSEPSTQSPQDPGRCARPSIVSPVMPAPADGDL